MARAIEAVIDVNGNIRLLESVEPGVERRALVIILDEQPRQRLPGTALVSEAALAEDWNRPEEEEAWASLQQGGSPRSPGPESASH